MRLYGQLGTCKTELREIDKSGSTLPIPVGRVLDPSATMIGGREEEESK